MKMAEKLRAERDERFKVVARQRLECIESLRARRDQVEQLVRKRERKGYSEATIPLGSILTIVKPDVESPDDLAVKQAATTFFKDEGFSVTTESRIGKVSLLLMWRGK